MKIKKATTTFTFKEAIEATPDVRFGYKTGLSALGKNSSKISVSNTSLIGGSLDIDTSTSSHYPTSNRWDYAFDYDGEVFFVEVHSAISSEVSTVIRKLQWLKDWLNTSAPEINKLRVKRIEPFYWVQSSNFSIPKTTRQYRAAVAKNIVPIPKLVIK